MRGLQRSRVGATPEGDGTDMLHSPSSLSARCLQLSRSSTDQATKVMLARAKLEREEGKAYSDEGVVSGFLSIRERSFVISSL